MLDLWCSDHGFCLILDGLGTTPEYFLSRGDDPVPWEFPRMAWLILAAAGVLEIGWAVGLKHTEGFTRLIPSLLTGASILGSLGLLGLALKTLPLGTAYAVWTGIGTIGTVAVGIMLEGEPAGLQRLACIGLIVVGIVGLKLTASS